MSKIAVIYWSGTGNTEAMAKEVAVGVVAAGKEADVVFSDDFNEALVSNYSAFAFGCPSMGAEVLEEGSFEPMFTSVESSLVGKNVVLFGSYGWGDGEWMRNFYDRCVSGGINVVSEPLICQEYPDDETLVKCAELGKVIAA